MIDHVGFAVSDFERAKSFYGAALAPLGYSLIMEVGGEHTQSGNPGAARQNERNQGPDNRVILTLNGKFLPYKTY